MKVSVIHQRKLPHNYKDPGTVTFPHTIDNTRFERCMLDLGASINIMLYLIYKSFNLSPLEEVDVIIQLIDKFNRGCQRCSISLKWRMSPKPILYPFY